MPGKAASSVSMTAIAAAGPPSRDASRANAAAMPRLRLLPAPLFSTRFPAAARMAVSIRAVVVLPFVPATTTAPSGKPRGEFADQSRINPLADQAGRRRPTAPPEQLRRVVRPLRGDDCGGEPGVRQAHQGPFFPRTMLTVRSLSKFAYGISSISCVSEMASFLTL